MSKPKKIRQDVVDEIVKGTLEGRIISSAVDVTSAELAAATKKVKDVAKKIDLSTLVACTWATYQRATEAMEFGTAAKLLTILQSLVIASTPMGFTIKTSTLEEIEETRSALSKAVTARKVNGYDAQVIANVLNRAEDKLLADQEPEEIDEQLSDEDAEARIAAIHATLFSGSS